jgi:TPP-dependent pyruvate/acetoin dehydrogenase alpha subunit
MMLNKLPPEESLSHLYRQLLWLRHSEDMLANLYAQQEMRTPTHFGTGQEAVAVGVCEALEREDVVYSHHRCHNHYLAKGGCLTKLAAELYGRVDGCSAGRGGSVHLTDRASGFIISSAILAQTIPVATGSALAFKMDGKPHVAVCFFGDATCEEGAFYESLNYASIHKLPVLFVCENNLYSTESTLAIRQPPGTELCERVRSFKIRAEQVDGNDVYAVNDAASIAIAELRAGKGPVFLECMTYRWREHVGPNLDHESNRTYRSKEELELWMEKCPVKRASRYLLENKKVTEGDLNRWLIEIEERVKHAVTLAKASNWPDAAALFDHVW